MYGVNNPEDYLNERKGAVIKPIERKHSDTSLHTKEKEHEMKIQDVKTIAELEEKKWQSCCFSLHQESSLFFAKLIVSILVIALCAYQLISLRDCNYQSLYSSLLSSVITYWLSINKK